MHLFFFYSPHRNQEMFPQGGPGIVWQKENRENGCVKSEKFSGAVHRYTAGMSRSYKTKNFSAFEFRIFLWDRSREMKFGKEESIQNFKKCQALF